MKSLADLVILLPVYEDRDCLVRLLQDIQDVVKPNPTIVIVDDGSQSYPPQLSDLHKAGLSGTVLRLEENSGHQVAIAHGLLNIVKRYPDKPILIMDADGEDSASSILQLAYCWQETDVDVVAAERGVRKQSRFLSRLYSFYRVLFKILTSHNMVIGNYCLLSADAAKTLCQFNSLPIHFPATLISSNLTKTFTLVDRGERYFGKSRMTLGSLLTHAARSLLVFRRVVFTRLTLTSLSIFSILYWLTKWQEELLLSPDPNNQILLVTVNTMALVGSLALSAAIFGIFALALMALKSRRLIDNGRKAENV